MPTSRRRRRRLPDIRVRDGLWYRVAKFARLACCRCGLEHDVDTKITRGRIYQRVRRLP